jgi:UDP:flavonoid glycosyltransferase YjiC (YdhE family)
VVLLTYGTRGDVEPFVALALGLQRAGFQPRLAAPAAFASLAEQYGVPFAPLPGDPTDLARDIGARGGGSYAREVITISRHVAAIAEEVLGAIEAASAGADIVVHSFLMTLAGHELARRHCVPDVSAQMFPVFAPTSAFPAVVFPDWRLGNWYRRWTHWLVARIFWSGSQLIYGRLRAHAPHLPPLTGWPFAADRPDRPLILFAFSPEVIPPPVEWCGVAEVTGYWSLPPPPDWRPPRDLIRFLESGPAPVYIGFGSTVAGDAPRRAGIAVEALVRIGQRGILDLGWGGMAPLNLPASVIAVDRVPHMWLFPRMAAVVHHGGAGTTGAALRAGVPNIVVPFTSDQPFWGQRVFQLGVGPRPIPARRLLVERLTRALLELLHDDGMRERAVRLGVSLRGEDGIAAAVRSLAQTPARRSSES